MDSYAMPVNSTPTLLTASQPQRKRTARAADTHGKEADEGVYERTDQIPVIAKTKLTHATPDVLQPRPAMLRPLRQRLREQIPHIARRELHHAVRRQAHEGLPAVGRPFPRAECRNGTRRRRPQVDGGQVFFGLRKVGFYACSPFLQ